jgi:glycosyltransferase involved in cell wall biosynthesis
MYGGVETLLATLARRRDMCPRMEPHFALCYDGRLSQELTAAGAPVHMLGKVRISRPWTAWNARKALRALLDRERFDAVIAHMIWPLAAFGGSTRHSGSKLLFWAHSGHTGRPLLERIGRRTIPDRVVSTSQTVAGSLPKIFPNVPSEIIYCAVDLPARPGEESRSAIRREFNLDAGTVVIMQASRFESWKGHLLHLQALARIRSQKRWACLIMGAPQTAAERDHYTRVQNAAVELGILGQVRFVGARSDMPRLFAAADIYCQPNLGPEPFGIVFVESLWAGKPVVTTKMGGALEILDSSCAILVEPDDAALAEALERLIDSDELRFRLGSAGPARALSLCDPASQMDRIAACVEATKAVA